VPGVGPLAAIRLVLTQISQRMVMSIRACRLLQTRRDFN